MNGYARPPFTTRLRDAARGCVRRRVHPVVGDRRRRRAGRPLADARPALSLRVMADVRIATADNLDDNTPQTPGIHRLVAFDSRTPDVTALSAFRADIAPGAVTGAHHHGEQDTVLYVVSGHARYRWGDRLEHVAEAGPGDFVLIPAHTVHQEINASATEPTV